MTREEAIEAMTELVEESVPHVGTTFDEANNTIVRVCTRCGAEERKVLPRPFVELRDPANVPAGFDEELVTWIRAFRDAHRACR